MQITYVDVIRPQEKAHALAYDIGLIVLGSLLIALSAKVSFYLPLSPVPVTGQTLAVLMAGALMGRIRGALCVAAYLGEGMAGLPVFAGPIAGPAYFLGPSGGYLVGFVAAAYIVGLLSELGWDRRIFTSFAAFLLGNIALYVPGLVWLAYFVGLDNVVMAGLVPFIPGDILKILLAAIHLPIGWRILRHRHHSLR